MFEKNFNYKIEIPFEDITKKLVLLKERNIGFYSLRTSTHKISISYNQYYYTGIPIDIIIETLNVNEVKVKLKIDFLINIVLKTIFILYPMIYLFLKFFLKVENEIVEIMPFFYIASIILIFGFIQSTFRSASKEIENIII
ncbi:MAG: hypothetical protein IPK03_11625 [Bacteroidetes bacterium]|nr:hypothetical protein [Bacteroidota bacterium]